MGKFHSVNTEAMHQQFQDQQESKSVGNDWLKLKEGQHRLRIAPPWSEEGVPCRKIVNFHGYEEGGKRCAPLSLRYIFDNPSIARILANKKLITKTDLDLWKKHGDPMEKLAQTLKAVLPEGDFKKLEKPWPKTQFLFNVVNRAGGKVYKWSQSSKFYETIMQQAAFSPLIFDAEKGNDFIITATGESLNRRYSVPLMIPQSCPLNIPDDVQLFNLDEVMAAGVKTFQQCVTLITQCKADWLQMARINPAVWSQ